MRTQTVVELICAAGVVPVVVIDDHETVRALGEALKRGGLRVVEVTFRTAAAVEALRSLTLDKGLLVGAGTVVRPEQVEVAHAAGARFVVTPGFSRRVIERCRALDMPVIPGVSTPTEVIAAVDEELDVLKFFPAEASGGVAMLRALRGPFPDVRFIPTGGITSANAASYLELPSVAAVGGSWMVDPGLVRAGDFSAITKLAKEAVATVKAARG